MHARNTLIYVIGDLLNKAIPFFLLPLLTKNLTQEEYGQYSLFGLIIAFITIFIGNGMHSYISSVYYKIEKVLLKEIITNIINILFISTVSFIFILFIFNNLIYAYIKIEYLYIFLALLSACFQFITSINMMIFISEKNAKLFAFYQLSQSFFSFISMYVFVLYLGLGLEGALISLTSTLILFGMISYIILHKRKFLEFKLFIKLSVAKKIFKFGLPLIPHYLAGWIKVSIDRFLLSAYTGLAVVGLFSISYQLAMIMSILSLSINKVWSPYLLEKLSKKMSISDKIEIVKQTYIAWILFFIILIIIYYSVLFVFPYFIDLKYNAAKDIFPFIMIGFMFNGMYYFIAPYIFYTEKTTKLAYISMITAGIHLIMSFFIIKYYGLNGALLSIIISNLLFFLYTWKLAHKSLPMPWNLKIKSYKDRNNDTI